VLIAVTITIALPLVVGFATMAIVEWDFGTGTSYRAYAKAQFQTAGKKRAPVGCRVGCGQSLQRRARKQKVIRGRLYGRTDLDQGWRVPST
jgi:hypothetical protein